MFFQYLINGLTVGSVFALIAIGYSMIYGILGIVNFAHGDICMVGTFLSMILITEVGLPYYIAVPAAALMTGALGIFIERFAYRPIRSADKLSTLISAMGVSILLANLGQVIFGTGAHRFDPNFVNKIYTLSESGKNSITISLTQIYILVVTAVLLISLYLLVQKTKIGIAMRATSHNISNARLMGINTDTVIAFTFGVGSALACIAGILVGPPVRLRGSYHGLQLWSKSICLGGARRYR